ncbi:hypothetical protein EDB87DRAFT_1580841 [Lactarius vividus]|nr:hypothetical protein EDB87DRAFT_1580841 [Lactarius vividus]
MSYSLPHIPSGWHVNKVVNLRRASSLSSALGTTETLSRFMVTDETHRGTLPSSTFVASGRHQVSTRHVYYELYGPCTVIFFYRQSPTSVPTVVGCWALLDISSWAMDNNRVKVQPQYDLEGHLFEREIAEAKNDPKISLYAPGLTLPLDQDTTHLLSRIGNNEPGLLRNGQILYCVLEHVFIIVATHTMGSFLLTRTSVLIGRLVLKTKLQYSKTIIILLS